jgi:mono/diheme cytochrome c family protein
MSLRFGVLFFVAVLLAGCGVPDARTPGIILLTGKAVTGSELFVSQKCTDCHGKAGRGGFGPDLGSKDVKTTAHEELANTILSGRWFMPAFGHKLQDQDVADLLAFIDTLGS